MTDRGDPHARSGALRRRPSWLAVALSLTGVLLILWTLLIGFAATGVHLPALVAPFTQASSFWPAAGYLLLLGLFLVLFVQFRRQRRKSAQPISYLLTVVGIVAAVAAILGLFAYADCHADVPVLWQLYWTLELFVGIGLDHTHELDCPVWPTLAFQIARLLALGALFGGAVAALTVAARGHYSRGRLSLDPAARYFVGVDEMSLPLVAEALRDNGRKGRIYVVSPDPGSEVVAAVTALGAIHVDGFGDEPELLRRAVRTHWFSGGKRLLGLSEFACLSSDSDANLAFLEALLRVLHEDPRSTAAGSLPATERLAILVRIDEIHRGERWWRQQAQEMSFLHSPYTVDRIGVFDSTARRIVLSIIERSVGRPAVIVDGDNSTALAVVKHLAIESNWLAALAERHPERPPFRPHIVLTGPRAGEVARDAATLWDLSCVEISVHSDLAPWEVDRDSLSIDCLFAVLTDTTRGDYLRGERLAERLYAKGVWVVEATSSPVELVQWITDDPQMPTWEKGEGIVRMQPLILARSTVDLASTWERAARHLTQLYDPTTTASGRDYDPENLREVLNVGTVVRDQGLVWGPPHLAWRAGVCCDSAAAGGPHEPECVFDAMSRAERPVGSGGATEPPRTEVDTALENVLTTLRILGLSPWFQVARTGTLERAVRLTEPVSLETRRGIQVGSPGDWLVSDRGAQWVVSHEGLAESFAVSPPYRTEYTDLERVGEGMWARRAVAGETIAARGANSVAEDGDWVIREENLQWVVPRASFERGYRIFRGDPAPQPPVTRSAP